MNLGPTSLVDATGRVRARYTSPFPKALHVEVALLDLPPTPYVRYGDAPLALLAAAAVLAQLARSRVARQPGEGAR